MTKMVENNSTDRTKYHNKIISKKDIFNHTF